MKKYKVLVVDDEQEVLNLMKIILSEYFEVDMALDSNEALEKFEKSRYDIVFSDISMKGLNGIELFKKIREKNKDVLLVLITGFNDVDYLLKSIEIGVDSYIIKPIKIDRFKETLERLIKKVETQKKIKRYTLLLKSYEEAIDKATIVSKTDPKGIITYVNDNFCQISGYSKEELLGKPHSIVRHPDMDAKIFKEMWERIKSKQIWEGIIKNRKKNGESYYVKAIIFPVLDENGEIIEYVGIRENITPQIDPLTILKDKIVEDKTKKLVLAYSLKYDILEDFYTEDILVKINETVQKMLEDKFKTQVYYLGNGVYGFLSTLRCEEIQKIQKEINESYFEIDEYSFNFEIKIVAAKSNKYKYENAKIGLKQIKYSSEEFLIADGLFEKKREIAKNNIEIIHKIKEAIKSDNIISLFQPIINNDSLKVDKYESLVRIKDRQKLLSPYFFLEVSKKANLYHYITQKVIENTFRILNKTDKDISINLSSMDVFNHFIREKIFALLKEYKNLTSRIVFEILEDEEIKDERVMLDFINEVKKYGVKIAIDDFGSGYSSFKRIFDYKPDIVKIDGFLIKNILTDKYADSMVKSIVSFAKENNIKLVAEFVENEEIFKKIKEYGIDYSQGYFFGKPEEFK